MQRLTVRQFNELAVPFIKSVIGIEFGSYISEEDRDYDEETDFWGYFYKDQLIGLVGLGSLFSSPFKVWLGYFGVHPDFQEKGTGAELLTHIEKECHRRYIRWLFVETYSGKNFKMARQFYESHGFKKVGYLENFLRDGTSAVFYMKDLKCH